MVANTPACLSDFCRCPDSTGHYFIAVIIIHEWAAAYFLGATLYIALLLKCLLVVQQRNSNAAVQ